MRALVTRLLPDKRREKVLVHDWPEPAGPKANQVKTQTIYSGITNGTERNDLLKGNYATPDEALPSGWGYQNVGRVIEVGPRVKKLKVGDILYMSADHMEYTVMPENDLLMKLPGDVNLKHAALFGMASVAMRTCRNTRIQPGERVLVVGAGFIGQIISQIATFGKARVTLCDIDPKRLSMARKIGATREVVNVSGNGWKKNIPDAGFDAVIDVAGVVGMEDQLLAATRCGGRVIFIAGRMKVSYSFNLGQGREITIKQNSHFDNSDLAKLCRLVRKGSVKIDPLLKDVIPVSRAGSIYKTLRDKPNQLYGTVFVW